MKDPNAMECRTASNLARGIEDARNAACGTQAHSLNKTMYCVGSVGSMSVLGVCGWEHRGCHGAGMTVVESLSNLSGFGKEIECALCSARAMHLKAYVSAHASLQLLVRAPPWSGARALHMAWLIRSFAAICATAVAVSASGASPCPADLGLWPQPKFV